MRLREALEERGLSLQRLRAHLALRGVDVSVATLSYWVNGRSRPTRGKSLVVLRHLERILEVPPGTLLMDSLSMRGLPAGASLERAEVLERAIREHDIMIDERRVPLFVHQIVHIGADRAQQTFEQRILARAEQAGPDRWSVALQNPVQTFEIEQTVGCRLLRTIDVPPDVCIFEFVLDRPMAAGEMVMSTVRIGMRGNGNPVLSTGFGTSRGVERVVVEARFDGEVPARFWRSFTAPGGAAVHIEQPVYLQEGCAQCTLEAPAPGLHSLHWEW